MTVGVHTLRPLLSKRESCKSNSCGVMKKSHRLLADDARPHSLQLYRFANGNAAQVMGLVFGVPREVHSANEFKLCCTERVTGTFKWLVATQSPCETLSQDKQ